MRPTVRSLARYLEAGTPTGLTGLWTHSTPRSTLLFLYGSTLQKLQTVPESSLYRQSVEAVTKHRMSLVESLVPPGYEAWSSKARDLVNQTGDSNFRVNSARVDGSEVKTIKMGNRVFVVGTRHDTADPRKEEWDGEINEGPELEGIRTVEERADQAVMADRTPLAAEEKVEWDDEPQLTADQYVIPGSGLVVHGYFANAGDVGSTNSSTRLAPALSRRSSRSPRASLSSLREWSRPRCKFNPGSAGKSWTC
jgi:NADH dehydrogenase (ubiquinone) 1 alpha subcomplex subunit 5